MTSLSLSILVSDILILTLLRSHSHPCQVKNILESDEFSSDMLLHLPPVLLSVQLLLNHHRLHLLLLSVVVKGLLLGEHKMMTRLIDEFSFISFCEKY